jgi:hypothetical protein
MATKTKARPTVASLEMDGINNSWFVAPLTLEERLVRIQALGKRIDGYIKFMCGVRKLDGSSPETKEKTVAHFYDRLLAMEQELGRIEESIRLG